MHLPIPVLLLLGLCLFPGGLWSQVATGAINGVIKDTTGAVIPGADVTVTEQQTDRIGALVRGDDVELLVDIEVGDRDRLGGLAGGELRRDDEGGHDARLERHDGGPENGAAGTAVIR